MPSPSLREIARSLGLSHTTVSEALRKSPRVRPETRMRVLRAAREAGYQPNPLAGALMSEMRRSRAGTFRGVLAIIDRESVVAASKFVLCRTGWFKRYEERLLETYRRNVWPLGADFEPHWCLVLSLDTRLASIA